MKNKIEDIVDFLIQENQEFQEIDKEPFLNKVQEMFSEVPPLSKEELEERIEKICWVEVTAGLLDDLSDEEMKRYKEASKRRPFFKE